MVITSPLSCKVVVSLSVEWNPLPSLHLVGGLIDGLSTATVDSLYNTLKVVTKPIDSKHKKAA